MAVVSSRLKDKRGSILLSYDTNGTLTYLVETDDKTMTLEEIYQGAILSSPDPVPPVYALYGGGYVLEVNIAPQVPDNWLRWVVTAKIGPLPSGSNPGDQDVPVLQRKAVRSVEFISETHAAYFDRDGKRLTNTNNEPLPEPDAIEVDTTIFVISKNYPDLGTITTINETFNNTSNSDTVNIRDGVKTVAPYTLKFSGMVASEKQWEGSTGYYVGTSRVIYQPDTWQLKKNNEGYRVRTAAKPDGKLIIAVDEFSQKVVSPVLLAQDGTQLPDGNAPFELAFDIYNQIAYQALFDDP